MYVYSPSTASSGQSGAGGSSYNSPAATDIAPANSGNSSAQGSSFSLGGTTKGGVTNSGSSPYGNSGNPKATGVSSALIIVTAWEVVPVAICLL
ncbi:hypothetical protein [Rickettsia massiliae]|uniref:hypothetical protein n=1 Tax=Rickettsia massiliae TaxID=35791 RepID=UPI0003052DAB|nr:hypothetical protein [Rickettsia massiliae]